jgi:hypothetical protein
MKKLLTLILLLTGTVLTAQTKDSLFRWSMTFNKYFTHKDSCYPTRLQPDTILLSGQVDFEFDTLWFSYNDALFNDTWGEYNYYGKYYLEFRDGKDNLVHIESSFYQLWRCVKPEPPYDRYDSTGINSKNIFVSLYSLTNYSGFIFPYLNVYFYKDGHNEKRKLCVLDFIMTEDWKKKK